METKEGWRTGVMFEGSTKLEIARTVELLFEVQT